jgi:hypothetical protein
VFQRVTAAQRFTGGADDSKFEILNPHSSSQGLWSELRFRLRRPLGILTGTIDKLLINPSANGQGVDVEIIDFKTNRFRGPAQGVKQKETAAVSSSAKPPAIPFTAATGAKPAQALFDFDALSEVPVSDNAATSASVEPVASLHQQAESAAHDYQLQMQSYASALRALLPAEVKINRLVATLHFIDPNVELSFPEALLDQETCLRAIDDAMQSIASLDGSLDADLFPPLPATRCRICNFVELCPAGREWLRASDNARRSEYRV